MDEPTRQVGVELPALTAETLRQPYLPMPSQISQKQRRTIHEVCEDVGLYHVSVGQKKTRQILVSIYHDGFEYLPDFQKNHQESAHRDSHAFTVLSKLKPWALKRASANRLNPKVATEVGRKAIYQFIDQPGECLREGVDFLDFQDLDLQDLSQTTPPSFQSDAWMLVDTPEKMEACVQELEHSGTTEIAFDLECYNKSKYMQVTCLIQLAATNGKEYVIDPLAPGVWEVVPLLAPLFANPNIVKIGHSIGGLDVRSLHRDFGIFVVNAFDTYEAARCLRLPSKGLAKVCAHYGLPNCSIYEALKAQYQTTDWTFRPLTEPMIRYGRYDVHYLILLRKLMMRDLARPQLWDREKHDAEAQQVWNSMAAMMRNFDEDEEAFIDNELEPEFSTPGEDFSVHTEESEPMKENDGEKKYLFDAYELRKNLDLMQAISASQERCLDLWTDSAEPALKNADFQALVVRCKSEGIDWTASQFRLYEDLAKWRNDIAAEHECAAIFVCSLGFLASIAFRRPTDTISLRKISFDLPGLLQANESYCEMLFTFVLLSRIEDGLSELEDPSLCPSFQLQPPVQRASSVQGVRSDGASAAIWFTIAGSIGCAALLIFASGARRWRLRSKD